MAVTFSQVAITGGKTPGAVSVPGLVAGDVLISLVFASPGTHGGVCPAMALDLFEGVVTGNDQIQQVYSSTVDGVAFNGVFARFS